MTAKILIIILLLACSAILFTGKGWFLIAGYNMLDKEQRAKYDEAKFSRFMGWIILGITVGTAMQMAEEYWPGVFLSAAGAFIFALMMGLGFAFSMTGYFKKR